MIDHYRHGRTVLVRDDDGALLGTGTLLPRDEDTAEILRMSVARSRRRSGIGRQILDELLATAASWGSSVVVLETSSSWDGVVSFYLRAGFIITDVEEGDFGSDTWFERRIGPADQNAHSA